MASHMLAAAIALLMTNGVDEQTDSADNPPIDVQSLSFDELTRQLAAFPHERYSARSEREPRLETILTEFVRRGGEDAEKILKSRLQKQDALLKSARESVDETERKADAGNELDEEWDWFSQLVDDLQHVEVLTALRRVQRQPDPLAIIVDHPKRLRTGTREFLWLKVALKNVDFEQREFGIQQGGDYRSGRHARWRIHAWNEQGEFLPQLPSQSFIGGGWTDYAPLTPGETWSSKLPVNSYVRFPSAGKYRMQILYHDEETIAHFAEESKLDGLILYRSEPFDLIVEHGPMAKVHATAAELQEATEQVVALNEQDEIRLLIGNYDQEAHKFIDPKTPQGCLQALGWKAVPALIDALETDDLSYRKRGWILALLFSITRERDLDPTGSESALYLNCVLPTYRQKGIYGWSLSWGAGFSSGWTADGLISRDSVDETAQKAFAEKWLRFRDDYIEIVVHD